MTDDEFRRKLSFRSWHRGTREMDILMGRFADFILPSLSREGLESYALLLEENDPDLYDFYCGRRNVNEFKNPALYDLLIKFLDFRPS